MRLSVLANTKRYIDDPLACPECKGENLHQYEVVVFRRGEDDDLVIRTTIPEGAYPGFPEGTIYPPPNRMVMVDEVPNLNSGNPSSRRHGTVIRFWCENCHVRSELCISQHKGSEYLEWRINP